MGPRLGIDNWPPVQTSWGEMKMSCRPAIHHKPLLTFPEARDKQALGLHI